MTNSSSDIWLTRNRSYAAETSQSRRATQTDRVVLAVTPVISAFLFMGCHGAPAFPEAPQTAEPAAAAPRPAAAEESDATAEPLTEPVSTRSQAADESAAKVQRATFGSGCFWCTEAVFKEVKGVESVTSGYSGGHVEQPSYSLVTSGQSGHVEVVQIAYDADVISYPELLEIFWRTHDPTTLNRQGNDVGPQYRSVIFVHNQKQRRLAEKYKRTLDASGAFDKPIVTAIEEFREFYPAEKYHQDYFERNGQQLYCQYVIVPKLKKFRQVFQDKLKASQDTSGGR